MTHPAALDEDRLAVECELRFVRRSGPGGQHRNKTETAVVVFHRPTGISAEANERRSQSENRRSAFFRLRSALAVAIRTDVNIELPASSMWTDRVAGGKLKLSSEHADFPTLLAEALDRLAANAHRLDETAVQLQISTSQLIKLFKRHAPALEWVNRERAAVGVGPLR